MKIFHHCDPDGWSSASIVYKWALENNYKDINCISINYPQSIDVDKIIKDEIVFIVDYSISPDNMLELLAKTSNVTWIDHHKTAIEKFEGFPIEILGIRDTRDAACELTWKYLFPEKKIPESVKYIGDYDNWKWNYGEDTRNFFCGIKLLNNLPMSNDWQNLLINEHVNDIMIGGKAINEYLKMDNRIGCIKAYEVIFEGYKCIVLNTNSKGSLTFESIDDGSYDILITWQYVKNKLNEKICTLSLYSGKGKNIDVSLICKKYGGGGHKGASGMTLNIDRFLELGVL